MADYAPEEYTRHYIVQALFKLMQEYSYEKINVTDIVQKAGVGRATFYRYFKSKEDVITFYFDHNATTTFFKNVSIPVARKTTSKWWWMCSTCFCKTCNPSNCCERQGWSTCILTTSTKISLRRLAKTTPKNRPTCPICIRECCSTCL